MTQSFLIYVIDDPRFPRDFAAGRLANRHGAQIPAANGLWYVVLRRNLSACPQCGVQATKQSLCRVSDALQRVANETPSVSLRPLQKAPPVGRRRPRQPGLPSALRVRGSAEHRRPSATAQPPKPIIHPASGPATKAASRARSKPASVRARAMRQATRPCRLRIFRQRQCLRWAVPNRLAELLAERGRHPRTPAAPAQRPRPSLAHTDRLTALAGKYESRRHRSPLVERQLYRLTTDHQLNQGLRPY